MTNEDNYTKSIGFGYDQSNLPHEDCNLLNSTIAGYLAGYLRARGDLGRVQFQRYDRDNHMFYIEEHLMGPKDLFALRQALPEELRNCVRLYRVATRLMPEVIAMAIGDIEMTEMMEES